MLSNRFTTKTPTEQAGPCKCSLAKHKASIGNTGIIVVSPTKRLTTLKNNKGIQFILTTVIGGMLFLVPIGFLAMKISDE
jgi:hypothetical protein